MQSNQELRHLLSELMDCVRDDLATQERILEMIEDQRQNISSERGRGLEEKASLMVEELRNAPDRTHRRDEVLARFASIWSVEPEEVTLSMVVLRFGEEAQPLAELRAQLRKTSAEVVRSVRRFSALVSTQRRLVQDVLRALLDTDDDPGRSERSQGVLLDAEA